MRGIIEMRRASGTGKPPRNAPGQGLVEMAMISLIMVVLVGGIVDFGVYMYKYVQASNCVRESARRAVVRDASYSSPPYCIDKGLKPSASGDPNGMIEGQPFTATINSPYSYLALDKLIPMPALSVSAATTMRMEKKIST